MVPSARSLQDMYSITPLLWKWQIEDNFKQGFTLKELCAYQMYWIKRGFFFFLLSFPAVKWQSDTLMKILEKLSDSVGSGKDITKKVIFFVCESTYQKNDSYRKRIGRKQSKVFHNSTLPFPLGWGRNSGLHAHCKAAELPRCTPSPCWFPFSCWRVCPSSDLV